MSDSWVEFRVSVVPEVVDELTVALNEFVGSAFAIEKMSSVMEPDSLPITVRAFIAPGPSQAATCSKVGKAIACFRLASEGGVGVPAESNVHRDEYMSKWRDFYQAIPIGSKLMIVPAWQEEEIEGGGRLPVMLDPGAAFGTGHHPTTQLALVLLEQLMTPGLTVADVGTGSGVLAIAAARLGASRVVAFDNDEQVGRVAQSNIQRNGVHDVIQLCVPSERIKRSGCVDLVIANIVASVHLQLMSSYAQLVRPGGSVILSGILDERLHEVVSCAGDCGLKGSRSLFDGDWRAMVFHMGRGMSAVGEVCS